MPITILHVFNGAEENVIQFSFIIILLLLLL
jgi:hypothetical protein